MNPSHSITLTMYGRDFDFPNFAKTIYIRTRTPAHTHFSFASKHSILLRSASYSSAPLPQRAHMHNLGLAFEQVIGLPARRRRHNHTSGTYAELFSYSTRADFELYVYIYI